MAAERFFTPSAGVAKLLTQKSALHFEAKTRGDWRALRRKFRPALMRLLGEFPEPAPLEVKRVGCVLMDGYRREKIVFNPDSFSTISAYVLVPDGIYEGERRPAILCAHGHGSGKLSQVEPKDRVYKQIAVRLCRDAGFIVIAPDWRSFGERTDTRDFICNWPGEHGADGCDLSYLLYGYFGYQLLTLNIHDGRRCIDYLQSRDDVDRSRIGMIGLSFGGTMTTFTAAIDRRIKAAVISGYLSTIEDALGNRGRGNTCGSQFLFGLRKIGEIADVAGLIAPRPCMVQIGKRDACFARRDAEGALGHLRRIYRAAGAEKKLEADLFDGSHEMNVKPAIEFLRRRLET